MEALTALWRQLSPPPAPTASSLSAGPMPGVRWSAWSFGGAAHGPVAESAQRALAAFFSPALGARYDERAVRPSAGWPAASLGEAAVLLAAYCVLLAVGVARARARAGALVSDGALRPVMVAYNGAQVALSAWLACAAAWRALGGAPRLGFACNAFDIDGGAAMPAVVWLFMMSKVVDFTDTALIVVRGKWAQLSFLHCYHHATIFVMFWLTLLAGAQGDVYFTVLINSVVHTLMYGYYLLSTLGVRPRWGRYLTQFQMAQFVAMNTQALIIMTRGCAYPVRMNRLYLGYCFSLLVLFFWFYVDKHCRAPAPRAGRLAASSEDSGSANKQSGAAAAITGKKRA